MLIVGADINGAGYSEINEKIIVDGNLSTEQVKALEDKYGADLLDINLTKAKFGPM